MIDRLRSSTNPNLLLLHYDASELAVMNLLIVPKHFFVPAVIQERLPLAATARRAGWIGCNILLQGIPSSGRIFMVKEGVTAPKPDVLERWHKTAFLSELRDVRARGWLLSVMSCVERLNRSMFTLDEVYRYETELAGIFPDNQHVRAKIRQQLQVLRDREYLEFLGQGHYRLTGARLS